MSKSYKARQQLRCFKSCNISRHNEPQSKHSLEFDTPADDVVAVSACINQLLTLRSNVHLGNIPPEDPGLIFSAPSDISMFIHIITL